MTQRVRTAEDLKGVFAYTTELLRVEQYGQVAPTMLAGLADVVGGDSACLTHLDLVSQQQVAIRWPSVVSDSRMIGAYPTVGHTHPLRAPLRTLARKPPASLEPIRISDVLAPRAWRQTPFHREAMPDATDQICLPMALHGAVVHAVTLTRDAGRRHLHRRPSGRPARVRTALACGVAPFVAGLRIRVPIGAGTRMGAAHHSPWSRAAARAQRPPGEPRHRR